MINIIVAFAKGRVIACAQTIDAIQFRGAAPILDVCPVFGAGLGSKHPDSLQNDTKALLRFETKSALVLRKTKCRR